MRSGARIVQEVGPKSPLQVISVEDDHMIEAFSPDGSNQPFDDAVLPWAGWCRHDLLDVETCQLLVDCSAVHSIAITDQVTRGIPVGNSLNQLLSNPFRGGVFGDVEVQNFPPSVSENNEKQTTL